MTAMLTRTITTSFPLDLRLTLGPVRRGRNDPCTRFAADGFWRATRTPDGPALLHLCATRGGSGPGRVEAEAWGRGAAWAIEHSPALIGCLDDPSGFRPVHPLLARLHRRAPGLRIGRTNAVTEALLPTICEQKVTGLEARRSWHRIVRTWGEPAPGPRATALMVPPDPAVLAGVPYYAFHGLNVERKRAGTIRRACAQAAGLDALAAEQSGAAARLGAVVGVGPWSVAEVALVALGDPDAVSVGDYHLPHHLCFALAGEPRGTDERMLELLEPYRGHRGRVVRLVTSAGIAPPRRGPRMAPNRIAHR